MVLSEFIKIGSKTDLMSFIGNKLLSDCDFSDVTIVCADNQHLPAHRAVLCASSSFLRELLYDSQQQRTFLYLGRVQHADLRALLEFIYLGVCSVQRNRLEDVVRLAAELEVSSFIEESKIHQCDSSKETFGSHMIQIPPVTGLQMNHQISVKIEHLKEPNTDKVTDKQTEKVPLIHQPKYNQNECKDIALMQCHLRNIGIWAKDQRIV